MEPARDRRIRKALELVDEEGCYSIAILSKNVGLGRSQLQRLFKQEVGVALGTYIRRKKLKKARTLLETTDLSVKEIAHEAGYSHSSSFVRAFRETFGAFPRQFKQQHNSRDDTKC